MLFLSHSVSSDSLCVSWEVQLLPHWFSLCYSQCYRPTTLNTHSFFLLFLTHPLKHSVIKMCFECIKKEQCIAQTRMYRLLCKAFPVLVWWVAVTVWQGNICISEFAFVIPFKVILLDSTQLCLYPYTHAPENKIKLINKNGGKE